MGAAADRPAGQPAARQHDSSERAIACKPFDGGKLVLAFLNSLHDGHNAAASKAVALPAGHPDRRNVERAWESDMFARKNDVIRRIPLQSIACTAACHS